MYKRTMIYEIKNDYEENRTVIIRNYKDYEEKCILYRYYISSLILKK